MIFILFARPFLPLRPLSRFRKAPARCWRNSAKARMTSPATRCFRSASCPCSSWVPACWAETVLLVQALHHCFTDLGTPLVSSCRRILPRRTHSCRLGQVTQRRLARTSYLNRIASRLFGYLTHRQQNALLPVRASEMALSLRLQWSDRTKPYRLCPGVIVLNLQLRSACRHF